MDFSIVIAHRGNPMGLWMTIQSCEVQFNQLGFTREYIVVSNGNKETEDTRMHIAGLKDAKLLGYYSHTDEAMSPPTARQIGSEHATGKYLAFFDNHCLLMPDYFARAHADFEHFGMDMLHSSHRYDVTTATHYHYRLKLANNFWGSESLIPDREYKPYPIAMAGHGGFLIKTDVYREVGGYWTGFTGYGGEEPYFDLKMALLGKTNFIDPKVVHIHYVGLRGYPRHYTDDFCRNMMMAANIIGGEKWLHKVFQGLQQNTRIGKDPTPLYDLMIQAYDRSRDHAALIASKRIRTLDEQLELFSAQQISC